ncbi:MAG: hypothetical protein F4Z59_07385 [Gemmatimonadales bacterium]|nr:hypothetical protein [Gemmatimonadales bacterium]
MAPVACGPLPQVTVHAGETASVTACFNDPNGDALGYALASSNPSVATASLAGGVVNVEAVAPGSATIVLTARDAGGLQGQASFRVVVPNRPPRPRGSIPAQRVEAGGEVVVDLASWFEEPDGESLAFRVVASDAAVAGVALSGARATLAGLAKGVADITATATDPGGLAAVQTFGFEVPNRGPVAVGVIEGQVMQRGETRVIDLAPWFDDPDGDPLAYTASSSSPAAVAAAASGAGLRLTALANGQSRVTVTARDPEGLTATQSFGAEAPNRAPRPLGSIPAQAIRTGDTAAVDVSAHFADPDGDPLTYSASSSDVGIASVRVVGATIELTGGREGVAEIAVTAADPGGLSATLSFQATVSGEEEPPSSFEIEIHFATAMSASQMAAFESARARWMAVLADTELPDMPVPEGVLRCRSYERRVEVVDDLTIFAAVAEIDGVGGTLGQAYFCGLRSASRLPYSGFMEFDAADLESMETEGTLEAVILHEMGHVLGIGSLWDHHELLRDPSLAAEMEVDTHFAGAKAIRAFDEVGGAAYARGAKVPVENMGTRSGSDDSHWRKSVFGNELMNPSVEASMPLSAVTVASLADLGYAVRMDLADAYRLPAAAALLAHRRRAIPLGDDVLRIPIEVRDRNGRVVGVIPP